MTPLQIKSDNTETLIDIDWPSLIELCNNVVSFGISAQGTILIKLPTGIIEAVGGELYEGLRSEILYELEKEGNSPTFNER